MQLAIKLQERGMEVAIVTSHYVEDHLRQLYPGIRWRDSVDGIPVYRVPVTRMSWRLRLLLYGFFAFVLLSTKLRRFQILHAHQLISTGLAGAMTGWLLRRPVIAKVASGGYAGDLVLLRRAFFRHPPIGFLGQKLNRIISLTSEIRAELLEAGFPEDTIATIPNGVDTTRFHPVSDPDKRSLREKLRLPDGNISVFVGGLKPKKRVDFLISAWKIVQMKQPNSYLLIIGDGPLRPQLAEQCRALGLERNVSFVGVVDEVNEYLRASDLFVLPSLGEGLSNALLEAMATGLAVITTDTQGNRDVVAHGDNGLLFAPEDESELARCLVDVLSDESKATRLGQSALATVKTRFSLETVADSYIRLYSKLLGETCPRKS